MGKVRRVLKRIKRSKSSKEPLEVRYIAGLVRLYDLVRDVPGHIIEIGTGSGRNAAIFGELIWQSGQAGYRRYYGFDTFRGYTSADLESSPHLDQSAHIYSQSDTESRLRAAGLEDVCQVYAGDVAESLPRFVATPPSGAKFSPSKLRVALLYLDCNSYRAASATLAVIGQYLSPGAVVAVDETIQGGETEALAHWCEQSGYVMQAGSFGSVISAFVQVPTLNPKQFPDSEVIGDQRPP